MHVRAGQVNITGGNMNFDTRSFSKYLSTSVCAYALLAGHAAYAQVENRQTAAGAVADLEEVIVTGSRIVRAKAMKPRPH